MPPTPRLGTGVRPGGEGPLPGGLPALKGWPGGVRVGSCAADCDDVNLGAPFGPEGGKGDRGPPPGLGDESPVSSERA